PRDYPGCADSFSHQADKGIRSFHVTGGQALAYPHCKTMEIREGRRLRRLDLDGGRANALDLTDGTIELGDADRVVLAVPPAIAVELLPGLSAPLETRPIVNGHFRLPAAPKLFDDLPFLGVIGGDAQWLFGR